MRLTSPSEKAALPYYDRADALRAAKFFAKSLYEQPPYLKATYTPPDELIVIGSAAYKSRVHDVDLLALVHDPEIKTPDDLDRLVIHANRLNKIEQARQARLIKKPPVPVDFLPISTRAFFDPVMREHYRGTFVNPHFIRDAFSNPFLRWDPAFQQFRESRFQEIKDKYQGAE